MRRVTGIVASLICLLPFMASGQIYQYHDSQGNLYFTDKPTEGATKVEIKEPKISPVDPNLDAPPKVPTMPLMTVNPEEIIKKEQQYYTVLNIVTPVPDETVRNNVGLVDVTIDFQPELRGGDRVVLTMDGRSVGESTGARQFTLQNVDRGAHVLQFKIVDSTGKQLGASSPVTVFVHRARLGKPPG